jgi:hypothetical protein
MPKPQPSGLGALLRKEREEKEQHTGSTQTSGEGVKYLSDNQVGVHRNSEWASIVYNDGRPLKSLVDAHQQNEGTPTMVNSGHPQTNEASVHQQNAGVHQTQNRISVDARKSTKNRRGRPRKLSSDARTSDRHRSDLVRHAIRLDPTISKLFSDFCEKRNWTFQEFVEFAGVHLLNFADAHQNSLRTPLDDNDSKSLYLTKPFIINLYHRLTKNLHWKPADDRAGTRFNSADPRIIEYAMMATALRTKAKKIHSFAYFVPEIEAQLEEVAQSGMGSEALEAMLASARRHLIRTQGED